MIVSNCPRCNEAFRVPSAELPEDAYAKCPWCRETFSLSDVLTRLPPILEVLSADGQPIVSRQSVAAVVDDGASDSFGRRADNETVIDESWMQGQSPAGGIGPVDFEVADSVGTWEGDRHSEKISPMKGSPGRKKKGKYAGLRAVIGVVLGGALAFPIADGLLVLAGHPGLGLWRALSGDEGESSGRNAVAAALPVDLSAERKTRPKPNGRLLNTDGLNLEMAVAEDDADSAREQIMQLPEMEEPLVLSDTEVAQPDPRQGLPAAITEIGAAQSQAKVAKRKPGRDGEAAADATTQPPSLRIPAEGQESAVDIVPIESSEKQDSQGQPRSSEVIPASAAESLEVPKLPTTPTPQTNTTADESAEMIALADRAGKMVEAVAAYDGPEQERARRLQLTYEKIAMACDLASGDSEALRALATRIKESPVAKDIEDSASKWLMDSSRSSEGIALIGRPGADGEGQIITLESGKIVSVVGDSELPEAEKILAMGRIVDGESSVELVLTETLP